jgi:hypothetical protein
MAAEPRTNAGESEARRLLREELAAADAVASRARQAIADLDGLLIRLGGVEQ